MRTITLELLRHGPAHNQLLSPLTPYLALCENHGAVTIQVPFEHNQFLYRLDALGYRFKEDEVRQFQIKDTAAVLGELLGAVPGFTAETNKRDAIQDQLTHLRLIISASELALLPFEMALSPAGVPGSGQHLLLQSHMPVTLTREVRRAPDEWVHWTDRPPRILFAAAAPNGVGDIPVEAHLLALRRAIQPWVNFYDPNKPEQAREIIDKHFVFLPEASVEAIEEACATGSFTHVHILAHGLKCPDGQDMRYALALHDARNADDKDYVSGSRLATALRASERSGAQKLSSPAVVTLASCDSANVGSVAGAGASIAHALHEAGIAMVVAGQFPLSFGASVRLVEVLYEGLLWGADPRHLIFDVRRRLYSQFPETHDWASLTAYLSLPPDFDQALSKLQITQALKSFNAAMSHADAYTRSVSGRAVTNKSIRLGGAAPSIDPEKLSRDARDRMSAAKARLEGLLLRLEDEKAQILGYLASVEKREAEVLFRSGSVEDSQASNALLVRSRDHYWGSFLSDRARHWAVTQFLSLRLVTKHFDEEVVKHRLEKSPARLWTLAHTLSSYDLSCERILDRAYALSNMVELYFLALHREFDNEPAIQQLRPNALNLAKEHADKLIDIAGWESFEVYSTRRQLLRYLDWFIPLAQMNELNGPAEEIFARFPEVEDKF